MALLAVTIMGVASVITLSVAVVAVNRESATAREAARQVRAAGFRLQINTTATAANVDELPRVLEIMKRAIAETPGVLTKPPNTIIVREFTDADIILELRFWTESTRSDFLDAASHVAQSVVAALKREGIALPEADLRYLQWWDEYRQERGIGISKQ